MRVNMSKTKVMICSEWQRLQDGDVVEVFK